MNERYLETTEDEGEDDVNNTMVAELVQPTEDDYEFTIFDRVGDEDFMNDQLAHEVDLAKDPDGRMATIRNKPHFKLELLQQRKIKQDAIDLGLICEYDVISSNLYRPDINIQQDISKTLVWFATSLKK